MGRPWPSSTGKGARPSHGRAPYKPGDPLLGPRQFVSSTSFDVSRCLEGQTTSESYETRTVASVSKRPSQRFKNHVHTSSVLREKPRKPRKRSQKSEPTLPGRPPSPPTGELGHVGRPWPSSTGKGARPSHGRAPYKPGDPLLGPRQFVSSTSFDVSRCLEGQTTSESYETRTVASVSKRPSQRFKNHVHTSSVLREKPRKPRKRSQKSEPTLPGRPPSPPTGELGHVGRPWPSSTGKGARPSHGRAPHKAGDPLLGPRQFVSSTSFDVSRCLEGQTTSESYETRTVASVSKRPSQRFENHVHTSSVLREKPRKPRKRPQKGEPTLPGRPPSPPTGELGHVGRPWPSSTGKGARPSHGRAPYKAGDPLLGPRQFVSSTFFDVSRCLEGQTTSESYETRTVASVSKRPSQRFKNHVHTSSVLREKPRKPRKRPQKGEPTLPGRPPSPPTGELGHVGRPWPSSAGKGARPSHGRAPHKAGDPLLGPRQFVSSTFFDVSRCLEGQTTSESYETRTVASVSKRPSQRFKNHVHTSSVLREKPRKPRKRPQKGEPTSPGRPPSPPTGELGHVGRPWPSSTGKGARPSHGRAPMKAGDPLLGPRQFVSSTFFDVSRCLEGQTTSESYETRTVASGPKRPSQRFKNHNHTSSVLREKPRKPRKRSQKSEPTLPGRPPSPPTGELGHVGRPWPSSTGRELGHPMAELPTSQGTPFWVPDSSFLRRPSTFRGVWRVKRPLNPTKQGPLRPFRRDLRNGSRIMLIRVRCFEKSPENQGNALKSANLRWLADPRAPRQGSSAMWVGHGRAPQAKELGHPMAELPASQGTPFWVPDSSFLRRPSTF